MMCQLNDPNETIDPNQLVLELVNIRQLCDEADLDFYKLSKESYEQYLREKA